QKQHPDELFNLLSRVVPYLRHKDWETRSTAAKAIGKIVENAPFYDPNEDEDDVPPPAPKDDENGAVKKEEEQDSSFAQDELFKLDSLNLDNILNFGRELPGHNLYDDTQRLLNKQGTSLEDPAHAPKLTALRDLLVDCGIGVEGAESNDPLYQPIKPHRALVFCQMKEMLDMVQNTVLKSMLPSVSFL
ncbi:hypothetical protein BN1723_018524, partial [Verticillium longisporum]